jgi:hypothetical protein
MKTNGQRLNQAQFFYGELRWIKRLWRHRYEFRQCAIPLHAECLVELTGIGSAKAARRASSTIRVGI